MIPGKIIGDLRNVHIYNNAMKSVKKQLSRDVNKYDKCEFKWLCDPNQIDDVTDDIIDLMEIKHFQLENYKSYNNIKTEMLSRDE